jgi:hypothetical protein
MEIAMATKKEIQAVKKTIKQWEWLAEHPSENKRGYFEAFPRLERPLWHLCYLCDIWNNEDECEFGCGCPLATEGLMCDTAGINNPFSSWNYYREVEDKEETKKQALRIVKACKGWLKEQEGCHDTK